MISNRVYGDKTCNFNEMSGDFPGVFMVRRFYVKTSSFLNPNPNKVLFVPKSTQTFNTEL